MSIKPAGQWGSTYAATFLSRTKTSALNLAAGSTSLLSNQVWTRFLLGLQSLASLYPAQAAVVGGLKWWPIEFAGRLRSLQQGVLNVGTSGQCAANLLALATAEANSPTTGWARYSPAGNRLQVCVIAVPGYVAPVANQP